MNCKELSMSISNLRDGDWYSDRNGRYENDQLMIPVQIDAPRDHVIKVNGMEARFTDSGFEAEIGLEKGENKVEIVNDTSGSAGTLSVYRGDSFEGRYRLSVDDCILFLKDINQHKHQYKSIFENPFLSLLKGFNQKHGTKVHLNLFYSTDGFDLSEMTDQYKDEWRENSDWLRLSFHAEKEFPDAPYTDASYQKVEHDCANVHNQIKRFAGEQLMSSVTTIHWGSANLEGCRALRAAGYKTLVGYFNVDDELPSVSYYLNEEQRRHIKEKFIWKDNQEDILFIRASIVIDTVKKEAIVRHLNGNRNSSGQLPAFVDFLVHEQYFYPDYFNFQPDYSDRIEEALEWASGNHYTSEFAEKSFLI